MTKHPGKKAHREAVVNEAGRINRAALRMMIRLKNEGRIIVLFPMGGQTQTMAEGKGGQRNHDLYAIL